MKTPSCHRLTLSNLFSAAAAVAVLALVSAPTSCHGFSVSKPPSPGSPSMLRPDASTAVEEALKITAAFGIESNEAKVAWDIVEEIDASDNSQAVAGSLDTECEVSEEPSAECLDYARFLDQLTILRDVMDQSSSSPQSKKTKPSLMDALKNIKLAEPSSGASSAVSNSVELTAALQEAKLATEQHGIASPEARLAWETYEEIASSGTSNAYGINLAEECGIESGQEACKAMEELERVMPILLAMSK